MKRAHFLSYTYPDLVKVLVKPYVYTYRSSEYYCRVFMNSLNFGLGFKALNYFKRQAELICKERI